ncbi:NAD-glutamate dehydrogenase domain-containing protein [Parasphingorhabdus pacifica]
MDADKLGSSARNAASEGFVGGSARMEWSAGESEVRCVVGWPRTRPPLADVLPLFEDLGLGLVDHRPEGESDEFTFRHELTGVDDELKGLLGEAFLAAWERHCDRDTFARLTPAARLRARQVQLVRTAFRYLRQAGLPMSHAYASEILVRNATFLRRWVEFFEARFDPDGSGAVPDDLDALIEAASTRDEDRLLRWLAAFGRAATRTNYFRRDEEGRASDTIVVKLDPAALPFLPVPRPAVETFVHHPDVEGLHLRFGRTARGGVRWSDRMEDYRGEVLALVKAQQDALIVPAGAKGAFITRSPVKGAPAASAEEVRRCYRIFVRGLLDITDNILAGAVHRPPRVVATDGDDPYLVVAADKGTAAFSDVANGVAREAGFWLDDAFASGGSSGYDHKQLGVTARGAWVCVRRHLAELGVKVDTEEITAVGIGDMSGDVFGNGMLLSPKLRLIAAFDHRHIFVDPDPDAERSYAERQRLAAMARSSWADYDSSVLSTGGGVFSRSAPLVPITPEVARRLDVDAAELTPDELVQAILRAPVDLLWNGGVGTYVKASGQQHADVGDRAHDRVRIDASELRCRVIGEGGNLGLTQPARIEYARRGGKINADFIDNAAGVNISDREVNLKVLLRQAMERGELSRAERDRLLADCSPEVVGNVLEDNRRQTLAISLAEGVGSTLLDRHERVMLEHLLDRAQEQLPGAAEITARRERGEGMCRPEIAVLLSHSKNIMQAELMASDETADPVFLPVLRGYFPELVRHRFANEIATHPLAADIVATRVANDLIDRMGPGFISRLEDRTGASITEALRAYLVVRDVLHLDELWDQLDSADPTVPFETVLSARQLLEGVLEHNACWLLRRRENRLSVGEEVSRFSPGVQALLRWLAAEPGRFGRAPAERGLPETLARRVAAIGLLVPALDLTAAAERLSCEVTTLAEQYFLVGEHLELDWIAEGTTIQSSDTHRAQMARAALRDELCAQQRLLAVQALEQGGLDQWAAAHRRAIERARVTHADLATADRYDIAVLAVAVQALRDLMHATADSDCG